MDNQELSEISEQQAAVLLIWHGWICNVSKISTRFEFFV